MSVQYDAIQGPYAYLRTKSISLIERENVQTTVAPFIKNARVLELACGSGFYTYQFLKWGASSVVGVDISPVMLEGARQQGSALTETSAIPYDDMTEFIQADCSIPTTYPGGPFDLVFGAWLFNYAPDRAGLIEMYRNIAMNLKDGGRLVSVTVPPAQDPISSLHAEGKARPPPEGAGGFNYTFTKDVEDGIYFHVHGDTPVGDVDVDCYHLKKEVYESAARTAGFNGPLEWGLTSVTERYLRGEGPGGASIEELETYKTVPDYGILSITK